MIMVDNLVKVASIAEFPDDSVRVVDVNGKRVALCRVQGEFYAVADLCTHDGGPLAEGELIDCQLECPRHGSRFDLKTGKALCLPAYRPVPVYKVELRGDDVYVGV